jgi:hypothetical protein
VAKIKNVYFTADEEDLFKHSKKIPNFSKWVKLKLAADQDAGSLEALINKLIDARLGAAVNVNHDTDFGQFM